MSNLHKRLDLVMKGAQVVRYHTLPTIKQETVGQHSFLVAWLVILMYPNAPSNLITAALQHDLAECETGDLPAPVKRRLNISQQFAEYEEDVLDGHCMTPERPGLSPSEERLLKLSDRVAGALNCTYERQLGNKFVCEAYHNFMAYAEELQPFSSVEFDIINYVKEQWTNACK